MMKRILMLLTMIVGLSLPSSFAKEVQVSGYTKKDGTVVAGYSKTVKDSNTTKVAGYTKKDGTKVKGYTRKKAKGESKTGEN